MDLPNKVKSIPQASHGGQWLKIKIYRNIVLSSSLRISAISNRDIGEFCALQPAPCALSQTSWGHDTPVKQTILDSWRTLSWYWYPYQPIPSYLTVCHNLQLSLKQKIRSPRKDSIMQLSISFIALAVGKEFAFSICSSIILRFKPVVLWIQNQTRISKSSQYFRCRKLWRWHSMLWT